MTALRWLLALILAGLFFYMAHFKFLPEILGGANPVFPTIAANTGFALAEPYLRWITGGMEILTGLLLLIPRTRVAGAGLGLLILIGALAAHATPVLGIEVEGVGASLFYMALGMLALTFIVLGLSMNDNKYLTQPHERMSN